MKIDRVFYNTIGSWYDDPIYMVFLENSSDSVTVFTLEDKVILSGVRSYTENKDIIELYDYLKSLSFHDRIELIKNFDKSKKIIDKFNL